MKDRTREAIYNLIGTEVAGCHAIDLFAGTGALGLEAISRGAHSATFIEQHVPTAGLLEKSIASLEITAQCTLHTTSAFLWVKRDLGNMDHGNANGRLRSVELEQLGSQQKNEQRESNEFFDRPWLVFCSPPYSFYVDRLDAMVEMIGQIQKHAPAGSMLVVEAADPFDMALLPGGPIGSKRYTAWQVRTYAPAVVGVWRG
jgi:16S rRNA (guanine966-N2)-methyltransferase